MLAIQQHWPNAQIDVRDPAGVWTNAIDPLRVDQIQYGIKMLAKDVSDWPPTPAQFAAKAKAARDPVPVVVNKRIAKDTERDDARRACQSGFAMRICGKRPKHDEYTGDFLVETFLDTLSYPGPDFEITHVDAHKPFWDTMHKEFDEAWNARSEFEARL
jgi:hypothetical protein